MKRKKAPHHPHSPRSPHKMEKHHDTETSVEETEVLKQKGETPEQANPAEDRVQLLETLLVHLRDNALSGNAEHVQAINNALNS